MWGRGWSIWAARSRAARPQSTKWGKEGPARGKRWPPGGRLELSHKGLGVLGATEPQLRIAPVEAPPASRRWGQPGGRPHFGRTWGGFQFVRGGRIGWTRGVARGVPGHTNLPRGDSKMGSSGAQRLGLGIVLLQAIACGPPAGWECTSEAGGLPCPNGTLCRGPSQLPSGHEETATVPRCYAVCESTFDCTSAAEACLKNSGESTGSAYVSTRAAATGWRVRRGLSVMWKSAATGCPTTPAATTKRKTGWKPT